MKTILSDRFNPTVAEDTGVTHQKSGRYRPVMATGCPLPPNSLFVCTLRKNLSVGPKAYPGNSNVPWQGPSLLTHSTTNLSNFFYNLKVF